MILFQQILLACLSLFVVALTVAVVFSVLILKEVLDSVKAVNSTVKDARRRFNALTGFLDTISTFFGGIDSAKKKMRKKMVKQLMPSKAVVIGFFAGLKKGVQVLVGGDSK